MHINIKYTNLESTPAIETYINEKLGVLGKFLRRWETEGEIQIFVEIGRTTKHHHKGLVYRAEANLHLPKESIRAARENWDVRVAVDEIKSVLRDELSRYHDKHNPKTNPK